MQMTLTIIWRHFVICSMLQVMLYRSDLHPPGVLGTFMLILLFFRTVINSLRFKVVEP